MKLNSIKFAIFISLALLLGVPNFSQAQSVRKTKNVSSSTGSNTSLIEKRNVRSHMEFLASDALQGRGSGTQFELIAGEYLASQMMQFGIEPAGDKKTTGGKSYIQTINISQNIFAEPPKMTYSNGDEKVILEHGKEMVVFRFVSEKVSGKLQVLNKGENAEKGAVAFLRTDGGQDLMSRVGELMDSGAAAILIEETPQIRAGWARFSAGKISFKSFQNSTGNFATAMIFISKEAADALSKMAEGTEIEIGGKLEPTVTMQTWNAVGKIEGSDPKLSKEVILLSAHMDHVGVRENAPGDDKIYNGADDDASGCVAVLELARVLASAKRPKRTVYFAFFGSEEAGGFGSKYFVQNLPFPLGDLVANLQFEMLGRPDPKVGKDELWLTGFERSNLGSELAKNGAKLVNDPHPEENFFRRSDNYTLAQKGVVAHTVSSFGLHKDYHQPSDEIETIDFEYMTNAINSMVDPVKWLLNSDFKPTWYEGKKP